MRSGTRSTGSSAAAGDRLTAGAPARVRAVEAAAERELSRVPGWLWDSRVPPVPVEALADSHYGLLVRESPDLAAVAGLEPGTGLSGLLLAARKEIWVNADEAVRAPGRRRFTIGHELGHWCLHRTPGGAVYCRHGEVSEEAATESPAPAAGGPRVVPGPAHPPQELEANQFAAALLMPRALVVATHARLGGGEAALARAFGVSEIAMQRRLWFLSAHPAEAGGGL